MVEISERIRRLAAEGGWIGVDLDGTMFTYTDWVPWNQFGVPIQPMIDRVNAWIVAGVGVRIFTARVGLPDSVSYPQGLPIYYGKRFPPNVCRVTSQHFSDSMMVAEIQGHCAKHGLPRLPVQCYKDLHTIEIWDDRAIQVVANTGRTLADEYAAELTARLGKQFQEG